MVGHDEVVALILPHQIGDGLHLEIHVAVKKNTDAVTVRATHWF